MRAVNPWSRLWWGWATVLLLLAAGAVGTWYWYATHPKPPPAGATLVGDRPGAGGAA